MEMLEARKEGWVWLENISYLWKLRNEYFKLL